VRSAGREDYGVVKSSELVAALMSTGHQGPNRIPTIAKLARLPAPNTNQIRSTRKRCLRRSN